MNIYTCVCVQYACAHTDMYIHEECLIRTNTFLRKTFLKRLSHDLFYTLHYVNLIIIGYFYFEILYQIK